MIIKPTAVARALGAGADEAADCTMDWLNKGGGELERGRKEQRKRKVPPWCIREDILLASHFDVPLQAEEDICRNGVLRKEKVFGSFGTE